MASPDLHDPAAATGSPLVITVESDGHGRFRTTVNGSPVIKWSRTPFFDAARVLIAEGCDPAATLIMRHAGPATDALVAEISAAARLMIREDRVAPEFVPYYQMTRRLDAGPPRVAQNDKPAVLTPPDAIDDPRRPHDASAGAP
jgi:hypothetical protein